MSTFINDRNTAAIFYLRQGKHEAAVEELSRAVQYHLASHSRKNEHDTGKADGASTLYCSNGLSPLHNCNTALPEPPEGIELISPPPPMVVTPTNTATPTTTRSETRPQEEAPNSKVYEQDDAFYEYAFELPNTIDQVLTCIPFRTQVTCVLLYNTALAYQLSGVQIGTGRTRLLHRAVNAYGLIFTTIGPHATVLYPALSTLLLGVCNNLTQLHLELQEVSHMKAARNMLRDFLVHTPVQQLSMSDLRFFHFSLHCFDLEVFHYAAAA